MSLIKVLPLGTANEQRALEISQQLGIGEVRQEEISPDTILLEVGEKGISLRLSSWSERSALRINFSSGKLGYRLAKASHRQEPLASAIGIKHRRGLSVVDATAGLGIDTVVLASLGCQVTALERNSLLHFFLADALQRSLSTSSVSDYLERVHLIHADGRQWLAATDRIFDVIYLDPMFPERQKSAQVKKEMQLLQALLAEEADDAPELLEIALQKAFYRVVVKRPVHAPALEGPAPAQQLGGRAVRFDIYTNRSLRESG